MTAAEVERLAREAGLHRAGNLWYSLDTGSNRENADVAHDDLARFAELVQAAERERCASLCDGTAGVCEDIASGIKRSAAVSAAQSCARLIRGD